MSLWYLRNKKWFNEWYTSYIDFYHHYSYDIWVTWRGTIYFPDKSGVGGVGFSGNSLSPNNPDFKGWVSETVFYFTEILDPKFPFLSTSTKFQRYIFKRIYWILTSPDGSTKVPVCKCLNLEVYNAVIEYENKNVKPAHYLIQIIGYYF